MGRISEPTASMIFVEKIGVVPQRAALFKGTIRENMKWGREDATDEEIWDALTTAQAREIVEGKDGQLNFKLEQNGRNLSGGQRQRLTIARAVVKKPEFLILDDSASALDFATDAALRKSLHQSKRKYYHFPRLTACSKYPSGRSDPCSE